MQKTIKQLYTQEELRQMQEQKGCVTAVISWPWDETGDIADLNDSASAMVTGDVCGLEDIDYRLVGCNVATQEVLIEVTGKLSDSLMNAIPGADPAESAARRTAWLNGSGMTAQELADVREHLRQISGRPLEINSQQEFV